MTAGDRGREVDTEASRRRTGLWTRHDGASVAGALVPLAAARGINSSYSVNPRPRSGRAGGSTGEMPVPIPFIAGAAPGAFNAYALGDGAPAGFSRSAPRAGRADILSDP